jgi:hypothetical protein
MLTLTKGNSDPVNNIYRILEHTQIQLPLEIRRIIAKEYELLHLTGLINCFNLTVYKREKSYYPLPFRLDTMYHERIAERLVLLKQMAIRWGWTPGPDPLALPLWETLPHVL